MQWVLSCNDIQTGSCKQTCPKMVDTLHGTICCPGPCCDEELFLSCQATTVEMNGVDRYTLAELNLHNAAFHIARSAGVGRWVGNLWESEWPGKPVSISDLMVLPLHRTISDLWITFLCMCMIFSETKSVRLGSPKRINSDIKGKSHCQIGFNWKSSLKWRRTLK